MKFRYSEHYSDLLHVMQGVLLTLGPHTILEFGAGYSTEIFARHCVKRDAVLDTIDINPKLLEQLRAKFISEFGAQSCVQFHHAEEMAFAKQWHQRIDILFLDGMEQHYKPIFDLLHQYVLPGGIIFAHDVEHIVDAIKFKNYMLTRDDYGCIVLPGACGLLIAQKQPETIRGSRRPNAKNVEGF